MPKRKSSDIDGPSKVKQESSSPLPHFDGDSELKLMELFTEALKFSEKVHHDDVCWLKKRLEKKVDDFDSFYEEYCYVVVASGFRGKTAARLTPRLVNCRGNKDELSVVFRNERKTNALAEVWLRYHDNPEGLRSLLTDTDRLTSLPFIGTITKFHLSRNLGIRSEVKPDLHLERLACALGISGAKEMVSIISKRLDFCLTPGLIDFALWIWCSHGGFIETKPVENDCCYGGYKLR